MMTEIAAYGVSFPHYQVSDAVLNPRSGKKGNRTIAYVDEDILTLAFQAACNCLAKSEYKIDALFFATTSPVFADRYHASFLADLLNLPQGLTALDFGSTPRAGTDALLLAWRLIEAGVHKNILIIASDIHFPSVGEELNTPFGHGACAVLLGKKPGIAEIGSGQSQSAALAEEFTYKNNRISLDPRFSRDRGFKNNLGTALKRIGASEATSGTRPSDFDAVILNSHYARQAGGLFLKSGFSEEQFAKDDLAAHTGFTGSAHALLLLISALEQGKRNILLFDYFNGTNAFRIAGTGKSRTDSLSRALRDLEPIETYQDYLALRSSGEFHSPNYKSSEMFSSEMMGEREKQNVLYLNGFECTKCKTIYFIKSARCKSCRCDRFAPKALRRTGTIYSWTREYYFPSSFPPISMAVVDLDGGGRLTLQMTDDLSARTKNRIGIGSRIRLVLRKMLENDMKPNYFWKGVLLDPAPHVEDDGK